jgi:hypothetical protein
MTVCEILLNQSRECFMNKKVGLVLVLLVFVTFALPSCEGGVEKSATVASPAGSYLPVVSPADPYAWFDKPLDNFEIPQQQFYEIVLHGSAYQGIAAIELRITGEPVITFTDPAPGETLVTLKHTWTPLKIGRYVLQARTRDAENNWSQTAVVTVNVVETATPTPTLTPTSTQTPTPTVTPTIQAGFTEPVFSPTSIAQYVSCPPNKVTAVISATTPGGIKVVVAFYRLVDKTTNDTSDWANVAMQPLGDNKYRISLQPAPPGGELRGFTSMHIEKQGDSFAALVQMQFVIQTNSGQTIRSKVYNAATLYTCVP